MVNTKSGLSIASSIDVGWLLALHRSLQEELQGTADVRCSPFVQGTLGGA